MDTGSLRSDCTQGVETYVYAGNGQRVEKYGPGGTPRTIFVYDAIFQ